MKVLVIGSGGREHAICRKLKESPLVDKLLCAPGNAGIAEIAEIVPIKAMELDKITAYAKENAIDLVFVAPDDPLAAGLVDMLEAEGVKAFGPRKNAAIIEGSKAFSKEFMKRHGIPTAGYATFDEYGSARAYIEKAEDFPIVLKADGLALGKGVIICADRDSALKALDDMMLSKVFGGAGSTVVIEEFLTGREMTVLAFTDGKCVRCMPASQDHKKAYDGDKGLNTGGMGAFAPTPVYTAEIERETLENIVYPTIKGLNEEGRTFRGVIYFGLMATPKGVKVIEYNARFGDPETQVVLPLLDSDLMEIVLAVTEERLDSVDIRWKDGAALTVVAASGGYPENVIKGYPITLGEFSSDLILYHAGTAYKDGALVTNGGRVFALTALGKDIADARRKVYAEIDKISFKDMRYRKDIGIK
ncbi:MAG: phosphoribosylamine--glycine ligase [Firmicutes bacterium]|uniref:Phosphoribosylamine--glycine ligase n=1 Tax=Candidatus Stercoripulliclostridium pullicola TaxID=2840953 RepID=A0A940ID37_9FIRM|nr:phosphoribosylamine--glycine ligase [Candidatus Stercoripulliclostridium pullicola]